MFCACPGSRIRTLKTTKYTINHPAYKNTGIIKAMNLQETSKKKENLKQYYKPVTYLQKFISQKSKNMEDKVFWPTVYSSKFLLRVMSHIHTIVSLLFLQRSAKFPQMSHLAYEQKNNTSQSCLDREKTRSLRQ